MQLSSSMEQAQMALQAQIHSNHGRVNDGSQGGSGVGSQSQHYYRAAAPRSMASPNWRAPQPTADLSSWGARNQGNYALAAQSQAPLKTDMQSGGLAGYAYCLDRGNGHYTRLIPADMLPPLRDIPAHQPGPAGMVILPDLQMPPPQGVPATNKHVALKVRAAFNIGDNDPKMLSTQTPPNITGSTSDMLQKQIDHIVATNPVTSAKKPKIYCDKWIHDGVCAFAQQGCKFRHEMPYDRELQMALGLYQGFPPWWKKYQAGLKKQQELKNALGFSASRQSFDSLEEAADLEQQSPAALSQQTWRKVGGARMHHAHASQTPQDNGMDGRSDNFRSLSFSGGLSTQNVWGPIERPRHENLSEPALFSPRRNAWAPRNGGSGSSAASEDF